MRSRAIPLLCVGVLLALAAARAASAWSSLPDLMSSHFGPSGAPNGWQSKGAFFTTFGVLGFGMTLAIMLLPRSLLRILPGSMINLPYRSYWLTPERRPEAMRRLTGYLDWFCVATTALLLATFELVLRANMARAALDNALMIALLLAYFAFVGVWLVQLWRGFRPPIA